MGWVESGQAWGERAADWAYLVEPYARVGDTSLPLTGRRAEYDNLRLGRAGRGRGAWRW